MAGLGNRPIIIGVGGVPLLSIAALITDMVLDRRIVAGTTAGAVGG